MTVDYDMAPPAPRPISSSIANFLRRSISISDLLRHVLRRWGFVIVGLVLGILVGLYNVWTAPVSFTATISLLPADSGGGGMASNDNGTLGLLAGLAGVNSGSVPKFTRFVAAYPTVGVARELDRKYDMVCRIYAGQCDKKTHQWRRLTGWNADVDSFFARLAHQPDPNGARTTDDLAGYITSSVTADPDKKTGMLTVTYSDRKPEFAAEFLSLVIQTANDYIKDQDRSVNQQYVEYLTRELTSNSNIAQREALSNLLIQQERNLMLTGVNVPYAASSMDRPTVAPNNPTRKILTLYAVLGVLFGMAAAIASFLVPARWRPGSENWTRS